ncbi:MAG: efflux RND transporter periplasmic adaptor subunit [Candidatus Sericytochromatia bacterium]|nr:efflux RND transporter periplasmic adaptor subunit [Candidatus Sericytochromatia bacterium]
MQRHASFKYLMMSLALIGLLGLYWIQRSPESAAQAPPGRGGRPAPAATAVETAPVRNESIAAVRTLTGTAYPFVQFTLANKTGGQLRQLLVDVGAVVRNGQLVAQMETEALRLQIQQLKADIEVIKAQQQEQQVNLDIAERELDRDASLFSNKLISATDFDRSRANLETSRARLNVTQTQIAQRREALKQAEFNLSETRVLGIWPGQAPMVVSRKLVEAGATLAPNTPIVELVQLNPLRVLLPVTEKDLGKIKVGQRLKLRSDAFTGQSFNGTLVRISPTVDIQTRTAEIEVHVDNSSQALKPGMFLKADIVLEQRDKAQIVPDGALVRREDLPEGIFLVNPDQKTVRFVEIQTGIVTRERIEVRHPKLEGQVVTLGNHLLKDGAEIKLRKPQP